VGFMGFMGFMGYDNKSIVDNDTMIYDNWLQLRNRPIFRAKV
jgi:hypothetical protein